jgi:hypothetical protein
MKPPKKKYELSVVHFRYLMPGVVVNTSIRGRFDYFLKCKVNRYVQVEEMLCNHARPPNELTQ